MEHIPTALITGAAKRVGKAIATHLAQNGYSVAIHYNQSAHDAERLANQLRKQYPLQKFEPICAKLENSDEVRSLIPKTKEKIGFPGLLINNASLFSPSSITETSDEFLEQMLKVNFNAPFSLIREYAKNGSSGNIINITDCRIQYNKSNYAAYTISKKALWELTKMAAIEFAPRIRVNALAPGLILPPEGEDEHYLNQLAKEIPMKRPGGLEPILKSIDYILNNHYLTGQLLFCDGGEHLI